MKGTTATFPYVNLPTDEDFILFPEDNIGTIPIDGSHQNLRRFSPFILEVIPPKINDPSTGQERVINYGLVSRVQERNKPFSSPLREVQQTRPVRSSRISPNISSLASQPVGGRRSRAQGESFVTISDSLSSRFTDRNNLLEVARQTFALDFLPPIVFLINPASLDVAYNAIQNFSEQTRYGFIFQRWGEELPELSLSCRIGGFIAGRAQNESVDENGNLRGVSGLQMASKKDSASYRQLMSLLAIYKNGSALVDTVSRSRAYYAVGRQAIHYDGQTWEGRINSFSYTEDENSIHGGLTLDIGFTVYKHYWHDQGSGGIQSHLTNVNKKEGGR